MTSEYHNYTLQTNPRYHKKEIRINQLSLSPFLTEMIAKLENTLNAAYHNKDQK